MTAQPARANGAAPLSRRLLSLCYEACLLVAVLWLASLPFTFIENQIAVEHARALYQGYVGAVAGAYFTWQWVRGGQTLAMKTWRLRVERRDGGLLNLRQAALRYILALAGVTALGMGFFWAFLDRDGQFLHDRLAGTRIIRAD